MAVDLGLQSGMIMMGYVYARIPLVGCIQFNPFIVIGTLHMMPEEECFPLDYLMLHDTLLKFRFYLVSYKANISKQ